MALDRRGNDGRGFRIRLEIGNLLDILLHIEDFWRAGSASIAMYLLGGNLAVSKSSLAFCITLNRTLYNLHLIS